MRTLGIILMAFAGLIVVSGAMKMATRSGPRPTDELSEVQQRMDVFIPGATVGVIGFALYVLSKRHVIITATPIDQWLSIKVTSAAAEHARQSISEGRYPPGAGLRIIAGIGAGVFEIKYDVANEGDDCIGEDNGINVFVERELAPVIERRTIDLIDGKLAIVASRAE